MVKVAARQGFVEMPGSSPYFQGFPQNLASRKLCYSAPQIGIETNDGDSESRERGLQADVTIDVTACDGYVD